jgi:hypothetical protein
MKALFSANCIPTSGILWSYWNHPVTGVLRVYCHSFQWHEQKDICWSVFYTMATWHTFTTRTYRGSCLSLKTSFFTSVTTSQPTNSNKALHNYLYKCQALYLLAAYMNYSEETSRNPTQNTNSSDSRQWWLRALGKGESTSAVVCKGVWPLHSDLQDLVCL